LEVRDKEIFQTDHPVPVFRDLKRLKGSFEVLKTELTGFVNPGPAKVYAELDIIEEFTNSALHGDVSAFVADFEHEGIEILNYRITRTETELDITGMVDAETRLEEVSPMFVLTKMMETGNFTEEDKLLIMQAFIQLTEMEEDGDDA
jgi:hypothetical protein